VAAITVALPAAADLSRVLRAATSVGQVALPAAQVALLAAPAVTSAVLAVPAGPAVLAALLAVQVDPAGIPADPTTGPADRVATGGAGIPAFPAATTATAGDRPHPIRPGAVLTRADTTTSRSTTTAPG
jgi:hypothetical protein